MGWWSESIMGGDTPLDYKGEFEDTFGSEDEDFNAYREEDGKEPIPFVVPTAEQGLDFINNFKWAYGGGVSSDDRMILQQVVGFLMIERGAPMSDELRTSVIQGIDMELAGGCETWNDPEIRISELQGFRKMVEAYPAAGAKVEMPHQAGLFEKLAEHLS